ncbi:hypothetical protein H6F93_09075 [Leptolyngbya sp. FACHB-671]|uniref:hypothetical protein n=1 Tax=Leptolyngbya sp. FACHB-671 TaxID=2692812 RepID=UPI001682D9CC|nr:hypothetical protein [Leptolyngbya sp. FACHB-671]MBD2067680.1 hypothetical protein [Leptolyngbya sp. FACHB-671]
MQKPSKMMKVIKVTDIKWVFSKKLVIDPSREFVQNLCLFVGEIIRSDEVGLIVWRGQPILMVRIHEINFETKVNYVEMINFKDSKLEEMLIGLKLVDLKLNSAYPIIIGSGFEIFCYRPKIGKPFHPKMYPTYNTARERAARILNGIFLMIVAPNVSTGVSFAQVDEKIATKFLKKLSRQELRQDLIESFATAVDNWLEEFYTDDIHSKQYKTKNRYPPAPKPLEGCKLHIITSDDDGNIIAYEAEA